MTDWTSLDYVVADVEGNGQQPPELVELAVVSVVGGVIGKPTSWLVRPATSIKNFATRIHGLTNKDVADCPALEDIKDQVLDALDASALIAHNAHVDVGVLRRQLPGWETPEVFDTLKLSRLLIPGQQSYRLGAMVNLLNLAKGLPEGLSPHRATYDALVTARLFMELGKRAGSLEALRQPARGGDGEAPALF